MNGRRLPFPGTPAPGDFRRSTRARGGFDLPAAFFRTSTRARARPTHGPTMPAESCRFRPRPGTRPLAGLGAYPRSSCPAGRYQPPAIRQRLARARTGSLPPPLHSLRAVVASLPVVQAALVVIGCGRRGSCLRLRGAGISSRGVPLGEGFPKPNCNGGRGRSQVTGCG